MNKQILIVALALAGAVWAKGMFAEEAAAAAQAAPAVTNAAAVAADGEAASADAAAEAPKEAYSS